MHKFNQERSRHDRLSRKDLRQYTEKRLFRKSDRCQAGPDSANTHGRPYQCHTTLRLPNVDSCQLSFVATGTTSGYRSVQMGSLSIYEYPSCVAPTELTVVNFPAANQVTLSWTNVNDSVPASWTVYIRASRKATLSCARSSPKVQASRS